MPKVQIPSSAQPVWLGANPKGEPVAFWVRQDADGRRRAYVRIGDNTWSTLRLAEQRRILRDILDLAVNDELHETECNDDLCRRVLETDR